MSDSIVLVLTRICLILGVYYDESYLASLIDECSKVKYLLNQIYYFLGGSEDA